MGRVVDAEGKPLIYKVRGFDRTMPDKITLCEMEIRPGGNVVAVQIDDRPVTVSAPPEVISYADAEEARLSRAEEYFEKERAAAAMEKAGAEDEVEETANA